MLGMVTTLLGRHATSASFTDKVTSTGSSFSTATLGTPVLTATPSGSGATGSVALSWTAPDFATSWDVFRVTATCSPTPTFGAALINRLVTNYTNTPVGAGTYCYAIKGKYQSWTSAFSNLAQVTINKVTPGISTTPNPASGTQGVVLKDSATLTGGSSATGTITFRLYPPSDPTCAGSAVFTEAVTVSDNGAYPTVGGYTTITTGTYRWTAAYSGDTNNNAVSSGCAAEPVTVTSANSTVFLKGTYSAATSLGCEVSTMPMATGVGNTGTTVTVPKKDGFVVWRDTTDAFTTMAATGVYSFTLVRTAGGSSTTATIVEIGYCDSSNVFTSLGSSSRSFAAAPPNATQTFSITTTNGSAQSIGGATGRVLAVRITLDSANGNGKDLTLSTSTTVNPSFFTGPVN